MLHIPEAAHPLTMAIEPQLTQSQDTKERGEKRIKKRPHTCDMTNKENNLPAIPNT